MEIDLAPGATFGDASAIGPKGILYLSSRSSAESKVYAIDTAARKVLLTVTPRAGVGWGLILSPDGTLYLTSADSDLIAIH